MSEPSRSRFLPSSLRGAATWSGGAILGLIFLVCVLTLPASCNYYNAQDLENKLAEPGLFRADAESGESRFDPTLILGADALGRPLLWRLLLGGAISLGIGVTAAAISMLIGVSWGLIAGYAGGMVDSAMMRVVDVLYGLPYILLVMLLVIAADGLTLRLKSWAVSHQQKLEQQGVTSDEQQATVAGFLSRHSGAINVATLFIAIGAVSWLTLARVVRGQVLSIKQMPYIEAARASGAGPPRILIRHVLPNLVGPVIVYTTLAVPQAILQESFLSFLGIGVQDPLPSWGNMAAQGLDELNPVKMRAWLLVTPCVLLGATLLALNFVGDGLRDWIVGDRGRTADAKVDAT